jgi:hypothetical protein
MKKLIAVAIFALTFAALVCGLNHPVPVQAQMFRSLNYPTGLAGWWKLCGDTSATSGCNASSSTTVFDSSGYGYTGTFSGTCSGSSPYCYSTTNKMGPYSGSFDGSTNYIVTGLTSALAPVSAGTITFWMYPTAFANYSSPVSNGNVNTDRSGVNFYFHSTGSFTYEVCSASGYSRGTWASNLSANAWYFVAGTWNGSSVVLYVNGGTSSGSTATQNYTVAPGYSLTIGDDGARSLSGNHFKGYITDVRVYNRALSAGEIAQMYLAHN